MNQPAILALTQLGLVYDAGGNVVSRRLRDGVNIGYGYDALNRLVQKDLPGSERDVTFGYDLLSRPISAVTSAQALSFTYDALGRNITQSGPLGTTTSAYDLAGRRTLLAWPDSFYVTYDYLVTGEPTAIRENGASSGPGVLASFGYDDLGQRIGLMRGNGTSTSYTLDPVSRLATLTHDLAGTSADLTLGFSYNPAGQIASTTRSNDAYAWTAGVNRNDASTANGLNQILTVGAGNLGYDARGNLTSTGANSYSYSSENLLLTGPSSASLVYDPLMRLYQESSASVAASLFQYDGQAMIGEYNGSGSLQKRYVHGPRADEPLVEYARSGGTFVRTWDHADERGSIIAQSNDSGATVAVNSYDEYGVAGAGNGGRFGYTGQAWLPSVGLNYYKARMYTARLGRFLQTDPIGYGDGMNWYNYVGGDPVNFTDPTGLACAKGEEDTNKDGCADIIVNGTKKDQQLIPGGGGGGYSAPARPFGSGGGGGDGDVIVIGKRPQKTKSTFEKFKSCAAAQYGFGDGKTATGLDLGKAVSELGSLPVFKPLVGIPVIGESSSFTNVLNYTSFKLGLSTRFEGAALRSFTKAAFGSVRVATVLGRANVVIGGALLAYDAASIAICTNRE